MIETQLTSGVLSGPSAPEGRRALAGGASPRTAVPNRPSPGGAKGSRRRDENSCRPSGASAHLALDTGGSRPRLNPRGPSGAENAPATALPLGALACFLLMTATILLSSPPAFAQRTDERDLARAKKYLEEDPEYFAKLPKVLWRRPMGPYVGDVLKGYYGGPGPAKLISEKDGHRFKVAGANFLLVWDDRRGGELSEVHLFDGSIWRHVNCTMAYDGRDTIPRYFIQRQKDFYGKSPVYYLNQATGTEFHVTRKDPDRIDFWTESRMVTADRDPSPWTVRQDFRVYATGVVICDFEIKLDGEETFGLRYARMGADLEDVLFKEIYLKYPVHFRWGSAAHGGPITSNPNWKKHEEDGMLAVGSASFGVSEFADFNNRFEFWLERPRPFVGTNMNVTATNFHVFSSGLWYEPSDMSTRPACGRAYEWELFKGDPANIKPPFVYRNRWVLAVGGPKVAAANAGAARRNNLLGARVVHWNGNVYPIAATLDKLARMGANVLVLGDAWHKPGSVEPRDAAELKVAVVKARNVGMRVVLSIPLDQADKAAKLFEGLLTPGRDGLMLEGLGLSAVRGDLDLAERITALERLRTLVGTDGILIGRAPAGTPAQIECAFLDAVTPGEDAAGGLLRSTDSLITSDLAVGCAVSPIVAADDRRLLTVLAAAPASPQVLLDRGVEDHAFTGLWKLLARLDGPVTHALSPRLENSPDLRVTPPKTPVLAYLTGKKMLLVVAAPSGKTTCKITLGEKLGVAPDAAGTLWVPEGADLKQTPVRLAKGVLEIPDVPAGEVRAYEFPRTPATPGE